MSINHDSYDNSHLIASSIDRPRNEKRILFNNEQLRGLI